MEDAMDLDATPSAHRVATYTPTPKEPAADSTSRAGAAEIDIGRHDARQTPPPEDNIGNHTTSSIRNNNIFIVHAIAVFTGYGPNGVGENPPPLPKIPRETVVPLFLGGIFELAHAGRSAAHPTTPQTAPHVSGGRTGAQEAKTRVCIRRWPRTRGPQNQFGAVRL